MNNDIIFILQIDLLDEPMRNILNFVFDFLN